jgi:hypothetical protein
MEKIDLNAVYVPSEDVVAREIEDEIIIVPLVRGIGDAEDDLFTLNETGRAVWMLMNGKNTLSQIGEELAREYQSPLTQIHHDITGLAEELLTRGIIVRGPRY